MLALKVCTIEQNRTEHSLTKTAVNHDSPDHQGVLIFQVSLLAKRYFGTITKCPDYAASVFIFNTFGSPKVSLIHRFHCM